MADKPFPGERPPGPDKERAVDVPPDGDEASKEKLADAKEAYETLFAVLNNVSVQAFGHHIAFSDGSSLSPLVQQKPEIKAAATQKNVTQGDLNQIMSAAIALGAIIDDYKNTGTPQTDAVFAGKVNLTEFAGHIATMQGILQKVNAVSAGAGPREAVAAIAPTPTETAGSDSDDPIRPAVAKYLDGYGYKNGKGEEPLSPEAKVALTDAAMKVFDGESNVDGALSVLADLRAKRKVATAGDPDILRIWYTDLFKDARTRVVPEYPNQTAPEPEPSTSVEDPGAKAGLRLMLMSQETEIDGLIQSVEVAFRALSVNRRESDIGGADRKLVEDAKTKSKIPKTATLANLQALQTRNGERINALRALVSKYQGLVAAISPAVPPLRAEGESGARAVEGGVAPAAQSDASPESPPRGKSAPKDRLLDPSLRNAGKFATKLARGGAALAASAAVGSIDFAARQGEAFQDNLDARRAQREPLYIAEAERVTPRHIFAELLKLKKKDRSPAWSPARLRRLKIAIGKRGTFDAKWWMPRRSDFKLRREEGAALNAAQLYFWKIENKKTRDANRQRRLSLRLAAAAQRKEKAWDKKVGKGEGKITAAEAAALEAAITSRTPLSDGRPFTEEDAEKYAALLSGWFGRARSGTIDRISLDNEKRALLLRVKEILRPVWKAQNKEWRKNKVEKVLGHGKRSTREALPESPAADAPIEVTRSELTTFEKRFIFSEIRANKFPGVTMAHAETFFAMWDRKDNKGIPAGSDEEKAKEQEATDKINLILNKGK